MGKNDGKPKGKMTSYAFFVQTCREEHKKKHPGETVQFSEFSKKCSEKWKAMTAKEKKRFEEMAEKDKKRYEAETMNTPKGKGARGKRKRTKDPNAPKRALSAFFFFCNDERASIRKKHPRYGVGDVAKELGKRWEVCQERPKFEELAAADRARYEKDMKIYKAGGVVSKPKGKVVKKKKAKRDDDDDDDDDDEEDEEEEEEEEEEVKESTENDKKDKKVSKKEDAKKDDEDGDGGEEDEEDDDGAREDSEE